MESPGQPPTPSRRRIASPPPIPPRSEAGRAPHHQSGGGEPRQWGQDPVEGVTPTHSAARTGHRVRNATPREVVAAAQVGDAKG